jgi:hypothetical protein
VAQYDADGDGKLNETERSQLRADIESGKIPKPERGGDKGRGKHGGKGRDGHHGPPPEIVEKYDTNNDAQLDETERAALKADRKSGKLPSGSAVDSRTDRGHHQSTRAMNTRLRLALIILVLLVVANFGWRAWASRGLVTIHADGAPVAQVVSSLEKQGGIRLRSNLPADATVTMHVRKVPLLHALEVLSANTGAQWSVAYFTARIRARSRLRSPPLRAVSSRKAGSNLASRNARDGRL